MPASNQRDQREDIRVPLVLVDCSGDVDRNIHPDPYCTDTHTSSCIYMDQEESKVGEQQAKYKQLCLPSFYNKPFPDQNLCSSFSVSVLKWTIFN